MPNQAWYDELKKGFNPDGTVNDRTYTINGKTTRADGSAPPVQMTQLERAQKQNEAAFTARGYDMQGKPYGPNPRYMNPKTGMIDLTSPYQDPKKVPKPAPANVSGGQASVPSVQQRMSRMGQAVQKGVNKGKIKSNQLGKYQVPGQAAGGAPTVGGWPDATIKDLAFNAPKPTPMPQKALTEQAFRNLGYK